VKYLVYRDLPDMSNSVYHVYVLHEGETYEIRERSPKNPGIVQLIETCFIVLDGHGKQVDKRIGDYVLEYDNEKQARIEASRLNCIVEIMEA
jgi:hypothetical protein